MPYKYKNQLDAINQNCVESYTARNIEEAFRFTFPTISDVKNFIPQGNLYDGLGYKCGHWALSFHVTKQQSKDAWLRLTKDKPNKYKKLGNSIASGRIESTDGICCNPDGDGHFDCHEFAATDFKTKFTVIENLM